MERSPQFVAHHAIGYGNKCCGCDRICEDRQEYPVIKTANNKGSPGASVRDRHERGNFQNLCIPGPGRSVQAFSARTRDLICIGKQVIENPGSGAIDVVLETV